VTGLWSSGDRDVATVLAVAAVVYLGPVVVVWLAWKRATR
jgi:hypothetical protein